MSKGPWKNKGGDMAKGKAAPVSTAEMVTPLEKAQVVKSGTAEDTVMVCCNHPWGFRYELSGGRAVELNGSGAHLRGLPGGKLEAGAYGLTVIPRKDWEEIKALYGSLKPFQSIDGKPPLVFARDDSASAYAQAAEYKDESRHGYEPVDVANDPHGMTSAYEK